MLVDRLIELFPGLPPEHAPNAAFVYEAVFDDLPLDAWSKEGSILTRRQGQAKLNFAPRRTYCTIGFRGRGATELYRTLGGECPTGEVTIRVPYGVAWDPEPIRRTIEWYLATRSGRTRPA